MRYIKVIVDKKPTYCIACALSTLHICGKENIVQPTSGAAYVEKIPDCRCLLREAYSNARKVMV